MRHGVDMNDIDFLFQDMLDYQDYKTRAHTWMSRRGFAKAHNIMEADASDDFIRFVINDDHRPAHNKVLEKRLNIVHKSFEDTFRLPRLPSFRLPPAQALQAQLPGATAGNATQATHPPAVQGRGVPAREGEPAMQGGGAPARAPRAQAALPPPAAQGGGAPARAAVPAAEQGGSTPALAAPPPMAAQGGSAPSPAAPQGCRASAWASGSSSAASRAAAAAAPVAAAAAAVSQQASRKRQLSARKQPVAPPDRFTRQHARPIVTKKSELPKTPGDALKSEYRLKVYWPGEETFFAGSIESMNVNASGVNKHVVKYEDGQVREHDLSQMRWYQIADDVKSDDDDMEVEVDMEPVAPPLQLGGAAATAAAVASSAAASSAAVAPAASSAGAAPAASSAAVAASSSAGAASSASSAAVAPAASSAGAASSSSSAGATGPASLTTRRLHVDWEIKKNSINAYFGSHDAVARELQQEIEDTFHHNKHLQGYSGRFTGDGAGAPEMLVFYADVVKQRLIGAVALYGAEIRTMIVLNAQRRQGYGREIVSFTAEYVKQKGKKELKLMCKPKHSGEAAPEYFYEKCGFARTKSQDAGRLDLNCKKDAHDRRVNMAMTLL